MVKIKKIIARRFSDFAFFFHYLRYRTFLAIFLSIIVGILDGFGLTMFLPLLQAVSGSEVVDGSSLGNLGFVIDGIQSIGIELNLLAVLIIMLMFFIVKSILVYVSALYGIVLTQLFIKRIRKDLLQSFNRIRFKFFVQSDIGRIQNSMTGEVDRVALSFRDYFKTIEQGILVAVYVTFALFIDPVFAVLVTIGGALTNILYRQIYRKTKQKSREFTVDSHSYQGQIIQHVANFKYLKATALTDVFSKQLIGSIDNIEFSRRKIGKYAAILRAAREPLMIFVVAIVIYLQVVLLEGSIGAILISLLFFYRALNSLVQLQSYWNRYLEVSGSVENIKNFQQELRQNEERRVVKKHVTFDENISLSNANFSYGDTPILTGINLRIRKNETLAFVGESGSGKTTLVNLFSCLLPVDSGEFLIDGNDLKDVDTQSFQKKIGYITQDPVIFNDTIFNNVTFWDDHNERNLNRFYFALNQASLSDLIKDLPDKEDTILGNNGINLSGGQKQRISIARELYKDIQILIMDEATSALDSETEQIIQRNIDELKGKLTILIVAHRLSTIRNADRIILMKNGKIVSTGTYEELIRKNAEFERMVKLQEL